MHLTSKLRTTRKGGYSCKHPALEIIWTAQMTVDLIRCTKCNQEWGWQ